MQGSNSQVFYTALTQEQKLNILLKALDERYKAIGVIRDRVQNVCLWTLGLFSTAGGWLLQDNIELTILNKLLFTFIVVVIIIALRGYYLDDLEKGFKTQLKIAAKIEETLGLCQAGIYRNDEIYPAIWSNAGTNKGRGNFFLNNYLLIYLGAGIFLICLWIAN